MVPDDDFIRAIEIFRRLAKAVDKTAAKNQNARQDKSFHTITP